jgi:hypothetical protein
MLARQAGQLILRPFDGEAMQIRETVSEDYMVAAFLKADLDSPRSAAGVLEGLAAQGRLRSVIDSPDLANPLDNACRARVLGCRGYRKNSSLFVGFPAAVWWQTAEVDIADLARMKVIDQRFWYSSEGSRLACDTAARPGSERKADRIMNDIAAVAQHLGAGQSVPELIVVGTAEDALVILDGHVRVMAALTVKCRQTLSALVGIAPDMSRWKYY